MIKDNKAVIREIKERLNIADVIRRYVDLRSAGSRLMGCCPFHQEKTASFSVNAEEGFFYCFGCQASGDIFEFYSRINGLDFKESLEQLAEECGISLQTFTPNQNTSSQNQSLSQKKQALDMYELAKLHFVKNLNFNDNEAKIVQKYLESRGLNSEIIQAFELGWSKNSWNSLSDTLKKGGFNLNEAMNLGLLGKNERGGYYDRFRERLMFPIRNLSGKVIAFGGRIIETKEGQAKYINSSDSLIYKKGEHLYGLFEARKAIAQEKSIVLTEGYMDVISLHQFGIKNSCAVLGTALTPEQVKRLGQLSSKITLIFDGDTAGRKAALRSAEMILAKGLSCKVVLMPESEDIDSLLHKYGKKAFDNLEQAAPDGLFFCVNTLRRDFAPKDQIFWVDDFLKQISDLALKSYYIRELASQLGIDAQVLNNKYLKESLVGQEKNDFTPQKTNNFQKQALRFGDKQFTQNDKWSGITGLGYTNKNNEFPQKKYYKKNANEAIPLPIRRVLPHNNVFEQQLLKFAVRYPKHIERLKELGADFFLNHPFAKGLWNKLVQVKQKDSEAEVFSVLTDMEKNFWIRCRMVDTLPKDTEEQELEDVCTTLIKSHRREHGKTCLMALRQSGGNSETDIDLLKALQETLKEPSEQDK
ncbi:DNA primase [Desulfovibrio litoralis]|uniref:DNA primase n=1 Tax=Desulfovibrio litoralis DSM 11393 TaxID=1121455 RepID=A0A1M7RZX5_9BACT|nr:DNA primase [Desulfovibrio litoralis]SHN51877.1 DNA primase [Desulfovibrio litoralis DSM 11393]